MKTINENISGRYSPMIFEDRMPEQEDLDLIFEAARWAPSSYNEQPWAFLIVRKDQEKYRKILETIMSANREWCESAPILMLSLASMKLERNAKPNSYAQYDLGMAVGNMLAQATSLGIYVHQMGGYDKDALRKAFDIPQDFQPMAMMALGYPGNPDELPLTLKGRAKMERIRKDRSSFVHEGDW